MAQRRMNLVKVDPTRTGALRRRFRGEMRRRFRKIMVAIRQFVVTEDAFGLEGGHPFQTNARARQVFRFMTNPQKLGSFKRWLKQQVDENILTSDSMGKPWTDEYVGSSYRQGVVRSWRDLNPEATAKSKDFFLGGQQQFLRDVFAAPETTSKIELLYTRAYDDLEGITQAMSLKIGRVLAGGLAEGRSPLEIARQMSQQVASLERTRAESLVQTEIIRAHAEGQLDSLEAQGEEFVGVDAEAEISTARDEKVCKLCQPLEGVVLPIVEARGLIPRHPRCRCGFKPAYADYKKKGQKRDERADEALEQSVTAEGGADASSWAGKELVD